ncbi:MAG: MurR/RpiR family transcriptional regulator [Rhodoferax sp.]|uniref:MurR/RpiR family transcriptional regulator n=1 Tax=Rhodoferax sp. TaxID=50421 RepID=UPI0008D0E739|nr:MurR/RpiR family transcriptional regulator [Rhodoferax sp.]MDP2677860.1 MurR/RpiR family transcriptional regulator [Rhodoferax sp.]OGB60096.1 MAG: RpiR family transcriptional regulator [Burkholderiales bacterium RIFOXYD12_FULL_59_19]
MTPSNVLHDLIQRHYAALSAADRKLADVLLAHQKNALTYSATELSSQAGVSKASAARFFRRLGFTDFQAFRQHLRDGAPQPSPLYHMAHQDTPGGPLRQHIAQDTQRLAALADDVTEPGVQVAVKLLTGARRVWVVGYRNGYMAAFYARALLSQVRTEVYLLNEGSGEDAELLAEIQPRDVLLAMDFRRRTHRLSQVVGIACEAGATLVLLTDARVSALAARAQAVFICPPQNEAIFDSYVSAISLINFLATAALAQAPKKARVRMARIEQAHAQLADLESQ